MQSASERLGNLVKAMREQAGITQDGLAKEIRGANRSIIAHLEQGLRLPKPQMLQLICEKLKVPKSYWQELLGEDVQNRLDFESALQELCGRSANLEGHESESRVVADRAIIKLFDGTRSATQLHALFNSILVFYGIRPTTLDFFSHYFKSHSFSSPNEFSAAVRVYQQDAVRLYSTFEESYYSLNGKTKVSELLLPIAKREIEEYTSRSEWKIPHEITNDRLPDLGYISAARVKQENDERGALSDFLKGLAESFRTNTPTNAINAVSEKTRRRMDSLLRKFDAHLEHGLFSPLFAPTAEQIMQEAERLAPKSESQIKTMGETQRQAMENLAFYLASDFLDVYIATSMRSDADFVSVNTFSKSLFGHEKIKQLKLRYFNPTQSWIDDRIAKGLVEALMLRRASATIYMAQKSDTFGKDSEASVALGQGKPVIVYVPRLSFPDGSVETDSLFKKSRQELIELLDQGDKEDIDDSVDEQAIFGKVLTNFLTSTDNIILGSIAKLHWADFDLFEEQNRITSESGRLKYRKWLTECINEEKSETDISDIRPQIIGIFVSNAITFERRAKLFREIHPLALQVILSSGVLNGILVVRTIEQCASILYSLTKNDLSLRFSRDELNYRLVENLTGSTVRVISRHRLLLNAFSMHYYKHSQNDNHS